MRSLAPTKARRQQRAGLTVAMRCPPLMWYCDRPRASRFSTDWVTRPPDKPCCPPITPGWPRRWPTWTSTWVPAGITVVSSTCPDRGVLAVGFDHRTSREGDPLLHTHLKVVTNGVPVLPARRLPSMLRTLPAVLGPNGSPAWPTRPGSASTPPPDSQHAWAPERPPLPGCTKAARSALDWFDQRRPGALPSSDDYGSSVEPAAKLHPLWQAFCSGGSEWWRRRSEGSLALGLIAASRSGQTVR
jgi:hypothetical protein